ncbi:hypothetical protein N9368_03005 [Alphaproteobacteria bacterium]|nr:hypothetical protein [Alphaproteobacteria bacterium]
MQTMIQAADNDYDIDDGIYFKRSQLETMQGNDKSASTVRQMICEALSDERFNDPPEVKTNCVRVNYGAGYHVDIPIYRTDESGNNPELASAEWIVSNARDVKAWFDRENQRKSPDTQNESQLRRIVRLLKCFAKSRESWKKTLPSGFALTILVCEQFYPCLGRDDISFYNTLCNINNRLCQHLDIRHPTTPNTLVNSGVSDAKTSNLNDRLYENLEHLKVTLSDECSQDDAVKAWGKAFSTDYFTEYVSRNASTTAVAEASFLPSRYNNSPLAPPNLWNGQAFVSVVKNRGAGVLSDLPADLPHVEKPRWNTSENKITISVVAMLSYGGAQTQIQSGEVLPKNATLSFSCVQQHGLIVPKDFLVKWQVVNTCEEAASNDSLRGGFEHPIVHGKREEKTEYCGIHWVEAFLIRKRDSALCGRSGRFFVVIDE